MSIATGEKSRVTSFARTAVMCGGFLLLLGEVRFEHRGVLLEDWRPWIPITVSGLMLLIIPLATKFQGAGMRRLLIACYGLTICLGLFGLFVHSGGHMLERLGELATVWTSNLQAGADIKAHHPPLLAPLAFAGLGAIGLIFCLGDD